MTSNVDSIPSAFVNIIGNSTFYDESPDVLMPELGNCPVRIIGCQPFSDITTTNANSNLLTTGTLATSGANRIEISPDTLNGPLAAKANFYTRYVFRDILIEYVSLVATTQAGGMSMSIREDGTDLNAATSFSENRQVIPSVTFPFRTDRAFVHYHYDGPALYFMELDSGTDAALRLTVQFLFQAWPSVSSIGNVSQGLTNIYYIVDMYSPTLTQGITLTKSPEEKAVVQMALEKFREKKKVEEEVDDFRVTPPSIPSSVSRRGK